MYKKLIVLCILLLGVYSVQNMPMVELKKIPHSKPTPVEIFMDQVAFIESRGNHKVVNQYGMMGKYQFSPLTVRGLGFRISKNEFLSNPELQDTVMYKYMKLNQQDLENYISKYQGKTINGVKITRASILAGAHFAGSGGMKNYLMSNGRSMTVDGNGTSIKKYMLYFNNIQLPEL